MTFNQLDGNGLILWYIIVIFHQIWFVFNNALYWIKWTQTKTTKNHVLESEISLILDQQAISFGLKNIIRVHNLNYGKGLLWWL